MENTVTSPHLPIDPGHVTTVKQFSDALTTDLTDAEITQALKVILPIKERWQQKFASRLRHQNFTIDEAMQLVDDFESELKHECADKVGLLVSVDVSDVFDHGGPPVIVLEGVVSGHYTEKYGFDHEQKEWEVKKSKERGEVFLGVDKLDG